MKRKQALILAGGKGTRLASRLNGLPKPLIDVCGKTLLEHQIELLLSFGYTTILLLVSHGADKIQEFCRKKQNWNIEIKFQSDSLPLGTAGSVLAAIDQLEDDFLILYGDTMLRIDLDRFESAHFRKAAGATIFLHPNDHPFDSDLVEIDHDQYVRTFHPYPHKVAQEHYLPNMVNAGLYYVNKSSIEPFANEKIGFSDFGKDLFPKMLEKGIKLAGYKSIEFIKDCGTPERLDKVCIDFLSGKIEATTLDRKQSVIFLDRDGTINEDFGYITNPRNFKLLSRVDEAIGKINTSSYRAVVLTNQPVIARGDCTLDTLTQIHNKLETLLGFSGAYLDNIYFCPHHPDRGFPNEVSLLKFECQCRKPNIGMVQLAVKEMNINLGTSWMIGDTTTDILTARKAGLRSILVSTGQAGLDYKFAVYPNYTLPDLFSAVNFITNEHPQIINKIKHLLGSLEGVRFLFVGGLSRVGKSNFSSCLKDALGCLGVNSVVIPIDGWIKRPDQRVKGVSGRYDCQSISDLINQLYLKDGEVDVYIPVYNKLTRDSSLLEHKKKITKGTIIILEGSIALSFSNLLPNEARKCFFLTIDESLRKKRFFETYKSRGLEDFDIEKFYLDRITDENEFIMKTQRYADWCLDSVDWVLQ